jgi:hypothetical protein
VLSHARTVPFLACKFEGRRSWLKVPAAQPTE